MNNLDEKDLLARELRERAGDVAGHPVSFTAVRASAKRLQRRRQVVTGAVAAAVASIALPTGVAVTAALNDNGTDTPGYVAGPSASASPTDGSVRDRAGAPSEPVPFTIKGLARGEADQRPLLPHQQYGDARRRPSTPTSSTGDRRRTRRLVRPRRHAATAARTSSSWTKT